MGIESYGLSVGSLPRGPRNSIADVADVKVGHTTVDDPAQELHTVSWSTVDFEYMIKNK